MPIFCMRSKTRVIFLEIGDAGGGIGGGVGRIELHSGEHPFLEAALDVVGVGIVGKVAGHQRREGAALRQRRQQPLAVGRGIGRGRDRRHQIGHHDRPGRTFPPCAARPPASSRHRGHGRCQSSGLRMVMRSGHAMLQRPRSEGTLARAWTKENQKSHFWYKTLLRPPLPFQPVNDGEIAARPTADPAINVAFVSNLAWAPPGRLPSASIAGGGEGPRGRVRSRTCPRLSP